MNPPETFWSKIEFNEAFSVKGCWNWKAAKTTAGYGELRVGNKTTYAHRLSYELAKGKIPKGLELDHLCRNPACVNPDHLEAVTRRQNQLRGFSATGINSRKTRCPRGHLLAGDNLVPRVWAEGHRECLICSREKAYERFLRNRKK